MQHCPIRRNKNLWCSRMQVNPIKAICWRIEECRAPRISMQPGLLEFEHLFSVCMVLQALSSLQWILQNWNALLDWNAISSSGISANRCVAPYYWHLAPSLHQRILGNCIVLCCIVEHSARRILQHCQQVKWDRVALHRCRTLISHHSTPAVLPRCRWLLWKPFRSHHHLKMHCIAKHWCWTPHIPPSQDLLCCQHAVDC